MDGPHTRAHRVGGHHPDQTAGDFPLSWQVVVPILTFSLNEHTTVVFDMSPTGLQKPLPNLWITGVNKERSKQHDIEELIELQLLDRAADSPGVANPLQHLGRFVDGRHLEASSYERMRHAAHPGSQFEDTGPGRDRPLDDVRFLAHRETFVQFDGTPVRCDCPRTGSPVTLAHPTAHTPIRTQRRRLRKTASSVDWWCGRSPRPRRESRAYKDVQLCVIMTRRVTDWAVEGR